MKKRRNRGQEKLGARPVRNRAAVVAVCLIVTLVAGGAILASGGGGWFAAKSVAPSPQGNPLDPGNPSKEYVYAGGRLLATEEPPAPSGCGNSPTTPSALVATAEFTPQLKVTLTWAPSANVAYYEVQRRQNSDPFSTLSPNPTNVPPFDDVNVAVNTAYVYRVRAVDAQAICPSEYSNVDLATTTSFAENVVTGVPIRAAHLLELATAVNAVRITAGLSAFNWTDSQPQPATQLPVQGGPILKDQMQKLRNSLDPARSALGLPAQPYTNQPLTQGTTVYAVHIQQLRDGVK